MFVAKGEWNKNAFFFKCHENVFEFAKHKKI